MNTERLVLRSKKYKLKKQKRQKEKTNMDLKAMMKKLEEAGCSGGSDFHLRSENIQKKVRVDRIPMLKNALKKKSKLLLTAELALPFNPETGKADETFNSDRVTPLFRMADSYTVMGWG